MFTVGTTETLPLGSVRTGDTLAVELLGTTTFETVCLTEELDEDTELTFVSGGGLLGSSRRCFVERLVVAA